MPKSILILGGGMGGLVAASELRKKLSSEHKIILIDRSDFHFFYPSLLWILAGKRTFEQIIQKFERLDRKGIEFHQAEITKIDLAGKKVQAGGIFYPYDYMIIALGAQLNYSAIAGVTAGMCLYDLPAILETKEKLKNFEGGKIIVVVASIPFKCPAAPYEAAMIINDILNKNKNRNKVNLSIFTPEDQPMPIAGPKIGDAVRKMIEKEGIKYFPKYKLSSVDNSKKEITFESGEKYNFDVLLVVPPHKAPDVVKEAGLLGDSGWISVDPVTLETKFQGVFAIGDIAGIKLSNGKPLPKAGVFAHFEAEVVTLRIADKIIGKETNKKFDGGGSCFLEVGKGRTGFSFGNFFAKPNPKVIMLPPMKFWHLGRIFLKSGGYGDGFNG